MEIIGKISGVCPETTYHIDKKILNIIRVQKKSGPYECYFLKEKIPENSCCVCFEQINQLVVLIPCGHANICATCAGNLQTCPICRANVSRVQNIYL